MTDGIEDAACVSFGLLKHVLRVHGNFFCLDDPQASPADEESIISRPVAGREFFDCVLVQSLQVESG